jgi:uncharacterized protein YndB with AHSA1/START domain
VCVGRSERRFTLETPMADIFHDFPINVPVDRVFSAVTTPEGLDTWWTQRSAGRPEDDTEGLSRGHGALSATLGLVA